MSRWESFFFLLLLCNCNAHFSYFVQGEVKPSHSAAAASASNGRSSRVKVGEIFAMLDGMFAFSIYDKILNKIFIVRDFFGEKPLYYTKNNDSLT